ncbi:MAG: redoxin family protein [Alphaproteobacteria bacterium]|nr:redoxin family protein [Alphaproteobacteria bacterium]
MTRAVPLIVFLVFAAIAAVLLLHKKPVAADFAPYPLPTLSIAALHDETAPFVLGDGTHLINFFASWCLPCVAEHAELIALKKQFPSVTFHGIAWNDSAENIDAMLEKHGKPYDHVWADTNGKAAIALGLRGVPETFIVRNGRVIYHLSGALDANNRDAVAKVLHE